MENVTTHSTAKLALAVFTSPAAAFEEITRRRLFGTALFIVALTGTVGMIPPIIAALSGQRVQWLVLGQCNPVASVGLWLLYALAMQKLLKWLGSQVDYVELLTLMGWSQLSLLLTAAFTIAFSYGTASMNATASQAGVSGIALFSLWYVVLMGTAVRNLSGSPRARGMLSYMVIHIAAYIAFAYTYGSARLSAFQDALPGLNTTALTVATADRLPWVGAAVIGLVIGALLIGKHLEWPSPRTRSAALLAGLVGAGAVAAYAAGASSADYYGKLLSAHRGYVSAQYSEAAKNMDLLLAASKHNLTLTIDTADMYYLAGDDRQALDRLGTAEQETDVPGAASELLTAYNRYGMIPGAQVTRPETLAQAIVLDRRGTVYDAQRDYAEALARFKRASQKWPEFREPWVRMAVTYDRMGKYDKAIEAANHAIKKLDAEATVAWVALAQAFAHTGDKTQEKAAIAMVLGRDKKLAQRIDSSSSGWKDAVSQLSREDLRSPLEKQLAPQPKQAVKPKSAKKPN